MIQPQNLKILIAEDEAELREILVSRFKVFGFQVVAAGGGDAAFEIFKNEGPIDTVVTDIRMPKGTGLELLTKIKALNPAHPKIFVVSAADGLSKQELYHRGAEGFLEKPYDTRVLIEMVRKSMLSNKERWRMPPNFTPEYKIEVTLPSFADAVAQKSLIIGRGGFLVKTTSNLPTLGQPMTFKITAAPYEFSGVGILKWHQKADSHNVFAGFEFVHINGPHAEFIYKWIEEQNPIPYIPAA